MPATSTSAPQSKASDVAVLPIEPPPVASEAGPPHHEVDHERWRSAMEGYVPVAPASKSHIPLTALKPFAEYIVKVHNRLHPIFSDEFLASLEGLPSWSPLHQKNLFTNLEIVIAGEDGRIVRMGIIRPSGLTAFDAAALGSVNRAQPFGPAPESIWSYDGNVYLHWEFHRELNLACSSLNSRPFLLSAPASPNQ